MNLTESVNYCTLIGTCRLYVNNLLEMAQRDRSGLRRSCLAVRGNPQFLHYISYNSASTVSLVEGNDGKLNECLLLLNLQDKKPVFLLATI